VRAARNDGCCSRSNGFILTIFHSQAGDLRRNDDSCVARVACAGTRAERGASALSNDRAVRFGLAARVRRSSASADHGTWSRLGSAVLARQRERGEGDASLAGALGVILAVILGMILAVILGMILGMRPRLERVRRGFFTRTGA
jgi:hypothetical protein